MMIRSMKYSSISKRNSSYSLIIWGKILIIRAYSMMHMRKSEIFLLNTTKLCAEDASSALKTSKMKIIKRLRSSLTVKILVRVDTCIQIYHNKCLYRDWFMQRKIEMDEFSCEIIYKITKDRKYPTCRWVVNHSEINYIKAQYSKRPEVNDHAY